MPRPCNCLPSMKGFFFKKNDVFLKLSGCRFGQTPGGPLSGPSHTVAYLQRLNGEHVDMILQFSTWVLKADLEEGFRVSVFLCPNSNMVCLSL